MEGEKKRGVNLREQAVWAKDPEISKSGGGRTNSLKSLGKYLNQNAPHSVPFIIHWAILILVGGDEV